MGRRLAACLIALWLVACRNEPTSNMLLAAGPQATDPDLKVAFIGDQGLNSSSRAVLQLIEDEGAHVVLHQGDFDYADDPAAWDDQINAILGADFPYFASVGNHDVAAWGGPGGYQALLRARLGRVPGAECSGDLGVKAACVYRGLFFLLSGVGTLGSDHEDYLRDQLAADSSIWSVCSWHKNQAAMQVGGKGDEVGWKAYDECLRGGALIATGHEHSYSRTHLMESFGPVQSVASTSGTLVVDEGRSFAFVSGLGGRSVRPQQRDGDWWASIYTETQGAEPGALFCTFNVAGDPRRANCYFKAVGGLVVDAFEVLSRVDD